MTQNDKDLLHSINQMAEETAGVGLCAMPFRILHTRVMELVAAKDRAIEYRAPKRVLPYKGWCGKCPTCGVVFLDDSTPFCGNCGQRIKFDRKTAQG